MNWKDYFEMIIDWKKLPAYKAETRIDSIIGFYLKQILEDFFKTEIIGIIPELPLRLGTLKPELEKTNQADRSYKVDFFAVGKNSVNYLIEFKTDTKSINVKQDKYLSVSKEIGTEKILEGILKISSVSTYKKKYNHLKNKLQVLGLLDREFAIVKKNSAIEIVYVLPSTLPNKRNVIDFIWIAKWLQNKADKGLFEKELANALVLWSKD